MADPRIALVLGGARSGKSAFAERLAARLGEPVLYVATATAFDVEMQERIAAHRAARPPTWQTLEAPVDLGRAIRAARRSARTILVDCLTLLASNVLLDSSDVSDSRDEDRAVTLDPGSSVLPEGNVERSSHRIDEEIVDLLDAARDLGAHLVVVSGEVGLGIVPPTPLGRLYRDVLGRANQTLAARADAVYMLIAGIAIDVKAVAVDESSLFGSDIRV